MTREAGAGGKLWLHQEADSEAQVIAFHDSREGIERVAKLIGRDDVLPYRSGNSPEDRRSIEQKLQRNEIRGVIATSALELGIDMPDLNHDVAEAVAGRRARHHRKATNEGLPWSTSN